MKRFGRLVKIASWIAVAALLLIVALTLLFQAAPNRSPVLLGYRPLVVLSGNMEPEFGAGSIVLVKSIPAEKIQVGDVISFKTDSGPGDPGGSLYTTHRVTAIDRNNEDIFFQTQGDANSEPDARPIPAAHVEGRVVVAFPQVGYLSSWVHTPLGFAVLILLPAGLLLAGELRRLFRPAAKSAGPGMFLLLALSAWVLAPTGPASAHFSDAAEISGNEISLIGFWDVFILEPGTAKATQAPDGPPDDPGVFPIASLLEDGRLQLDFGVVAPGNSRQVNDVFRIVNKWREPVTLRVEALGELASLVQEVIFDGGRRSVEVAPGESASVGIKLRVPRRAEPDSYPGVLRVSALDGFLTENVPAAISVALPGEKTPEPVEATH
ncbi:MAG: hypothetical protein Kow00129_12940 [Thermoleophilia bacterium]